MTRMLIFLFLALTALPFHTLLRGGPVHGLLDRVDREVQSVVYDMRSRFDFSLLPDDSN